MSMHYENSRSWEPIIASMGYRLLKLINMDDEHGVMRVQKKQDKGIVLIKITRAESPSNEVVHAFYHDFSIGAQLSHPNMARYFQLKKQAKRLVIVLSDNGGPVLTDVIPKYGFSLDQFFTLTIQLLDLISYIHRQGLLHLGLHSSAFQFSEKNRHLNLFACTKMLHMPNNINQQVLATDFYALGLMLYHWLTGDEPSETFCYEQDGNLDLTKEVYQQLDQILQRLLAPDSGQNYQSTDAIAKAIAQCQALLDKKLIAHIIQ